ncbi:MAG: polysaccharide biosynthesis C-terminal domain-containing protein [Bacteroidetes bacterium]|nr:polysaccharide biosynthesis C-terminal domain-containing protein [Bacteroidota bacterium]
MSIKKLAGQTLWYGVPSIATRFLGYILNFSLIYLYQPVNIADITQVYAIFPFLNILFTYGLETSYFRFSNHIEKNTLYSTLFNSLLISTFILTGVLLLLQGPLVAFTDLQAHPEFLTYMAIILFFDTLSALPFAKLRQEERPRKYAFIKLIGIALNVGIVIWYLGVCPNIARQHPDSLLLLGYDESTGIAYYLIGNVIGAAVTLLLLAPQWMSIKWRFDVKVWKEVMIYSMPLIIVGLGGMINDMLSRLVFQHVSPLPALQAKHELGVFAANFRLAILITIFIQMFRLAAEPFFFNQAKNQDAKATYARVMLFFVIACSLMFLFVSLYLDVFKAIMTLKYPDYGEGIHIVPILALGGVFLGIYYNLSIWYKLTNKNWYGAGITIAGALITIVLNVLWIPKYGYTGSAWATLICYLFMMICSYLLGQKYYPVSYPLKRIGTYLGLIIVLSILSYFFNQAVDGMMLKLLFSTLLMGVFLGVVLLLDRKNFTFLPIVGKYFK